MFPPHPLFQRFENQVTIGGQNLEWATRGADFILRPLGADETIVWFFLGRRDISDFFQPQGNLAYVEDGRTKAQHAVLGRQFWRFWHLPSGEECFLRKNYGIFHSENGDFVRFDFPCTFTNFSEVVGEDVGQFLRSIDTPDSDLEVATRWAKTPLQQRVRQLFVLRGGSFDEFEALIRGSLVLGGDPEMSFSLQRLTPGHVLLRHTTMWGAASVNPLFDILNRYFHLERTAEEWRSHDEFGDPMDVPYPVYTSSQPNQHERLEALLVWRDFLRDKMPTEEIEALLPKF